MTFFILLLASGLSGYAIGEIGQQIGLPFWLCLFLAILFGWILGGIA